MVSLGHDSGEFGLGAHASTVESERRTQTAGVAPNKIPRARQ